jgi:hypothetical protein
MVRAVRAYVTSVPKKSNRMWLTITLVSGTLDRSPTRKAHRAADLSGAECGNGEEQSGQ